MFNKTITYCTIILLFYCSITGSQYKDGPFKNLFDREGFVVSFIFYSEGDGEENNGVVIYLENKNNYNISFKFTLIFRAGAVDRLKTIDGRMIPREKRTGSNDGLFFIPFEDGRSLSEVGIKNCKVRRN